jgi:DNA-binding CsgD family transcriptional regulator
MTSTPNDDSIEALTGISLLEFIGSHADFSDFCQFLIMNVLAEHEPWGACIGNFRVDGSMEILGSFGMGEGLLAQYGRTPISDLPATGGTYLNGNQLILKPGTTSPDITSQSFQVMNSHGPNALALIESNNQLVGCVQILFMHPIDQSILVDKIGAISLVCRASLLMYRAYSRSQSPSLFPEPSHNGYHLVNGQAQQLDSSANQGFKSYLTELTARQLEILQYISLGLTNSSIARKIGFSESTVRQETIAIYRLLGVSDRKMATLVAKQNGLIETELSVPEPLT